MRKENYNWFRLGMVALLFLCTVSCVEGKVKLPALITDGMVLQREQPLKIWGTADAGKSVTVKFVTAKTAKGQPGAMLPYGLKGKKLNSEYTSVADADGKWSVTLPPLQAGGPYRIRINDLEVKNVLVGDVWLCSGQSNMELPVSRVTDMFAEEIGTYHNDRIRQIIVPKTYNFHAPQSDMPHTAWKPLTQENVMNFSALAYFFAKAAYEKTGIPVGLINSSWGGTPVEAWISEEGLKKFPLYINDKRLYEDDGYCARIKKLESENFQRWNATLYRGDAGLHEATPWYAANYDDSDWKEVDMFSTDWGNNGLNPVAGSHWLRKDVELTQEWEGKEAVIRLGCIIDADSVYVNGTFVGTTGYQYPPRIYKIPAGVLKAGRNNVTVRIISNGGQPAFVKEKPYKLLLASSGNYQLSALNSQLNKEASLVGNWKYHLGAPMPAAPGMMFFCYKPICLYNAMVAPLQNYGVRGVIWYQGESNVARRNEYASLLTALITDWRRTFSNDRLPFYIVELADFLHKSDTGGRKAWAEMRAEQARAVRMNTRTTLIRNSDLGEWNDIHPLDKKTLGGRVAEKVWEDMKATEN